MKGVVSEKGQVTIPKALRTRLGIRPGWVLEFYADRGRLVARKVAESSSVDEVWGTLDLGTDVDEYVEGSRGRLVITAVDTANSP